MRRRNRGHECRLTSPGVSAGGVWRASEAAPAPLSFIPKAISPEVHSFSLGEQIGPRQREGGGDSPCGIWPKGFTLVVESQGGGCCGL